MAKKLEWLNFWCPIGVGILVCGAALRWPDLGAELMAIGGGIIVASVTHQWCRIIPAVIFGTIIAVTVFFLAIWWLARRTARAKPGRQ